MKKALFLTNCLSALLLPPSPSLAADAPDAEVEARINRIINGILVQNTNLYYQFDPAPLKERMAFYHTPGVSIAVINQGRLEWARGFGVTEWGKTNFVTDTTLFQAASISKPVFALAVMRLVQQGKLDLDRDVNSYLTSWKVPPDSSSRQPKVTLRQILGHNAGFTVHGFAGYPFGAHLPSLIQILNGEPPANSARIRVTFPPGSQFRYSGGGIEVAQQAVFDVIGETFPRFMEDLVLNPLGMKHSTYDQPLPPSWRPDAASGHAFKYAEIEDHWHVYPEMAAAGLWTTPSDLARVGMDMQRSLGGADNTLLPASAVNEMLKPGLGGVGISFFVYGSGRTARFGHDGANAGFRSQMLFYEHEGAGCVVMVNADEGQALLPEIQRAIAREYNWPDYFPLERKEIPLNPGHFDNLVGQYQTETNGVPVLIVHRDNDKLMARLFGRPDAPIFPESETNFFFKNVNSQISFDCGGVPCAAILHSNGAEVTFKRFSNESFWAHKPLTSADCEPRANSLLQGRWQATLGNSAHGLRLIVRIAEPFANKFNAELDSPDQHANGQVLSVVCHSREVHLIVMAGYGMFAGKINDDDTAITGNWVQNQHPTPVTFHRIDPKTETSASGK